MKYHTLYVPMELWESIVEGSKLQLGMKPAQFALHLLRGNAVSTAKVVSKPEKIKKNKIKNGIRFLFYNFDTGECEWIYKKENPTVYLDHEGMCAKYPDVFQRVAEDVEITPYLKETARKLALDRQGVKDRARQVTLAPVRKHDSTEVEEAIKKRHEEIERRRKNG